MEVADGSRTRAMIVATHEASSVEFVMLPRMDLPRDPRLDDGLGGDGWFRIRSPILVSRIEWPEGCAGAPDAGGADAGATPGRRWLGKRPMVTSWRDAELLARSIGGRLMGGDEWTAAASASFPVADFPRLAIDLLEPFEWLGVREDGGGPFIVGSKRPSSLGMFDVLGNVAEYVPGGMPGLGGALSDPSLPFDKDQGIRFSAGFAWFTAPEVVEGGGVLSCGSATGESDSTGFRVVFDGRLSGR